MALITENVPETDQKDVAPNPHWSQNIPASSTTARSRGLSLRTHLIVLLGLLVLLATVSLGSIAYSISRSIIEGAAVREVGIAANARRQAIIGALRQQQIRARAVFKT